MVCTGCCSCLDHIVTYLFKQLSRSTKKRSTPLAQESDRFLHIMQQHPEMIQQVSPTHLRGKIPGETKMHLGRGKIPGETKNAPGEGENAPGEPPETPKSHLGSPKKQRGSWDLGLMGWAPRDGIDGLEWDPWDWDGIWNGICNGICGDGMGWDWGLDGMG